MDSVFDAFVSIFLLSTLAKIELIKSIYEAKTFNSFGLLSCDKATFWINVDQCKCYKMQNSFENGCIVRIIK